VVLRPSFKGANPARQAFLAGVKIIGATAHFAAEELDSGPIIAQHVGSVTHRDSVESLKAKSRVLERDCLLDAVRLYTEDRVVRGTDQRVVVL